jgi:two-component system, NarL family, nitrate/nitrite response regulator NarL
MEKPDLTPRQRRIAALACDGLSNKEIAWQIGISEASVKLDLHVIYKKLRVANRCALIRTFRGRLPELLKRSG